MSPGNCAHCGKNAEQCADSAVCHEGADPGFAHKLGLPPEIKPFWFRKDGVPRCGQEPSPLSRGCPSYDGKRCVLLGERPDGICDPAVEAMAKAIPGFCPPTSEILRDPTETVRHVLEDMVNDAQKARALEFLHRHLMASGKLPNQWAQPPCSRCGQEE